jgi:hypothetical protein
MITTTVPDRDTEVTLDTDTEAVDGEAGATEADGEATPNGLPPPLGPAPESRASLAAEEARAASPATPRAPAATITPTPTDPYGPLLPPGEADGATEDGTIIPGPPPIAPAESPARAAADPDAEDPESQARVADTARALPAMITNTVLDMDMGTEVTLVMDTDKEDGEAGATEADGEATPSGLPPPLGPAPESRASPAAEEARAASLADTPAQALPAMITTTAVLRGERLPPGAADGATEAGTADGATEDGTIIPGPPPPPPTAPAESPARAAADPDAEDPERAASPAAEAAVPQAAAAPTAVPDTATEAGSETDGTADGPHPLPLLAPRRPLRPPAESLASLVDVAPFANKLFVLASTCLS